MKRSPLFLLLAPLLATTAAIAGSPSQVSVNAVIFEVEVGSQNGAGIDILRAVEELELAGGRRVKMKDCLVLDSQPMRIVPGKVGVKGAAPLIEFLNTYVEALEDTGRVSVLSRPFVFTADGQEAIISSGQRVALPSTMTATPENYDPTKIEYGEVGIELGLLPKIRGKRVQLKIDYEIGRLDARGEVSEQELQTEVAIADGEIVVLGGLIEERRVERDILGSIPILKRVLGYERRRYEQLVLLQPHIIEAADPDAPLWPSDQSQSLQEYEEPQAVEEVEQERPRVPRGRGRGWNRMR